MSSKLGPKGPTSRKTSESELFDISSSDRGLSVSEFNEVDFDYDSVNSPGASSTSSEPVYIRQPGFEYHAHEFKANVSNEARGTFKGGGPPSGLKPLHQNPGQTNEPSLPSFKEGSPALLQSSFFPSPPHTPVSLFSPVQSPANYRDPPSIQPLKSSSEIVTKLVQKALPSGKSPPSVSSESSDAAKSRTGNHTPPGYSSSKGTKKKKPNTSDQSREGTPELSRPSGKSRNKREPLPMKMRALPQSFWLQPNKNNNVPPSCSVLPPLIIGKDICEVIEVPPVSPPSDKDATKPDRDDRPTERMIKVGNTDLLFRLFDSVEKDEKKKVQVVRRGRPRKSPSTLPSKSIRDEDPCLISTATESILPLLPERTPVSSGSSTPLGIRQAQGQQVIELVHFKEGDRTVSLPSLNADHGYSQLLSELVLRL